MEQRFLKFPVTPAYSLVILQTIAVQDIHKGRRRQYFGRKSYSERNTGHR